MKFTLDWLRRHLDTAADADGIAAALNALGLEVEGVEDRGSELAAFAVGRVLSAEPHPRADRLRVCRVDTGRGEVQVVCGAPNARAGMKGVFAPAGARIPGSGLDLEETEIRGVASRGMLCSERELGLSDEHEGIVELAADAPVGASFAALAGLDDPVFDLAVTPDRADCFGVRGIARDLAAAGLGRLKAIDATPVAGAFESPIGVRLDFDETARDACPLFVGRYFRGLKNGPSPEWMRRKLRAVGLRPISALVDITNWVTMDLCRPAHIYDADKVTGDIGARMARAGESFDGLDGKRYEAGPGMTAIADASGMLGLGGLLGGASTGVGDGTVNGFLEIALFDPVRTAATGRELGLVTDARQRFERGVDGAFAIAGMEIATRLVLEICGGAASRPVIAGKVPGERRCLDLRPSRVAGLGGADIAEARCRRILEALGFGVAPAGDDRWSVAVPAWRHDMGCEADLVEEILRVEGFDRIPMVSLPRAAAVAKPVLSLRQRRQGWARRALAARGLEEAVTYSFVKSGHARLFGGAPESLVLVNPISSDLDAMRPSGLVSLLAAVARNQARGLSGFGLFEIGPVYAGLAADDQKTSIAGLRCGLAAGRHWSAPARPVDAFDAKADAMAVLETVGAPVDRLRTSTGGPGHFHPGRSGTLRLGATVVAAFGDIHPAVVAAMDAEGPVAGFEVLLEDVPEPRRRTTVARSRLELSPYQAVRRDFAFAVDLTVPAETLLHAVAGVERELIVDVQLFDLYRDESLGRDKKSLAVAVTIQPRARTMTDDDLEALAARIVAAVEKRTGGTLRG